MNAKPGASFGCDLCAAAFSEILVHQAGEDQKFLRTAFCHWVEQMSTLIPRVCLLQTVLLLSLLLQCVNSSYLPTKNKQKKTSNMVDRMFISLSTKLFFLGSKEGMIINCL